MAQRQQVEQRNPVRIGAVRPKSSRSLSEKPKDLLSYSQVRLWMYGEQYGWDVNLTTGTDKRVLLMSFASEEQARTHFDNMRKQDYLPMSWVAIRKSASKQPRWVVEVAP